MNELVEFLRARYDEREQAARAASPGPWHANAESDEVLAVDDVTVADGFALSGPQLRATTAHIALNDPTYVLAEVEAKRRIVELHADRVVAGGTYRCCFTCRAQDNSGRWHPAPCPTLRLLALPFAEHESFRGEWRPTAE